MWIRDNVTFLVVKSVNERQVLLKIITSRIIPFSKGEKVNLLHEIVYKYGELHTLKVRVESS